MNYSCPHCQGDWTLGESVYRGGQVFSCGSCEKQSVIPLYCPKCCPVQMEKKQWLKTPNGHLGGQSFRCPSGHEFTVPVTRDEAHRRLREMGNEVGQYHQSTRIETLRDADTQNEVKGGYCSGVCYDWIRRALVSKDPKLIYRNFESTLPKSGPLTGEMSKQHRQDYRGALVQRVDINPLLKQKESQRVKQHNQATDERLQVHNASWAKAGEIYSQEIDRINELCSKPGTTQQLIDSLAKKAKQAYDQSLERLDREFEVDKKARTNALARDRATPQLQQVWAQFRREMDDAIKRQRMQVGKSGISARPFENLDLAAASDSTLYTKGLLELITAVMDHTEFKADYCAHVGVNPPAGGTGHAIAIQRQRTGGKYHFFDPNFGVYEMTKEKVTEAFVFLFRTAYPCWAGGGTSDNHPYEANGQTRGSYGIFRGNRVTVPTVAEERPPQSVAKVAVPVTLQAATEMPKIAVSAQQQTGPVVTGTKASPGAATAARRPPRLVNGQWVR